MGLPSVLQKGVRRDICWTAREKAVVDDAAKTAAFVINSDQDDRDEEVVLPTAVLEAAKAYLRDNPIFLWGHEHRGNPECAIGTCLSIEGDATVVRAVFQYDVEIPGLAEGVFARVKKGTIRSVSIGFIPKRWVTRQSPQVDIDALPQHVAEALMSGKIWVVHTMIELIEISQCFIGSNRQALRLSFGGDLDAFLKSLKAEQATTPILEAAMPESDTQAPTEEPKTEKTSETPPEVPEEAQPETPADPELAVETVTVPAAEWEAMKAAVAELSEHMTILLVERMVAGL